MEERMVQFISALRAGGVRVSLAESADAFTAVDLMGVQEREAFRLSLRATLVKDASGLPGFEEVQKALRELMELMAQMGMNKQRLEQMRQLVQANQKALEEQINKFAGQRIAENMSEQQPEDNIDQLMDRPFNALSDNDMQK